MTIHKEGYKILIVLLLILVVTNLATFNLLPQMKALQTGVLIFSLICFIMILQFFRSPIRKMVVNDKYIIAPADGKVVVIEEVLETEYFNDNRRQVSIFMSPINVHINRNPISGLVKYFKYHPGLYHVAWHPKASTENERTTVVVEGANKQEILFRQIAGALAKRIVWYVKTGETVKQCDEFGFIKFGSRVDLFLPLDAKVRVNIGEKTKGGQTILAEFV